MKTHFPFGLAPPFPSLKEWLQLSDIESKKLDSATWIPLQASKTTHEIGKSGFPGYRHEYHSIDTIIVPNCLRNDFCDVNWHSVSRLNPDSAWADGERFIPAGCYDENLAVRYAVIERNYYTDEPRQWELFQEMEIALRLLRKNDVWIRPDEDDAEVAHLERDKDGLPSCLMMKAEFLRDYLRAKNASLLITGFSYRDATEEDLAELEWRDQQPQTRHFENGEWEGIKVAIHEGGRAYGTETAVMHMWRESVDPNDDIPIMPHPTQEPAARSRTTVHKDPGTKMWSATGRIWFKHWIEPAEKSPRIRGDHVASRIHFLIENQEQKTLAGDELANHRGWLWFKPSVISSLLKKPKTEFVWLTRNTGEIGPSSIHKLHFGINKIGLINVLGYKMAELPEWVQRIWVSHNVSADGGLSEELHMSHNLGISAETQPPEIAIWKNLNHLQKLTQLVYGGSLFSGLPTVSNFFKSVHRFYGDSFEQVCQLSKELHRAFSERIDIGMLNSTIDPGQAEQANRDNLRQIKRLALWLNKLGFDGRSMTKVLAGIADLRQGDAHVAGSQIQDALVLLGIDGDSTDYPQMCIQILAATANTLAHIGHSIESVTAKE